MNNYTQDDLKRLKELFPSTPSAELIKYFPGHTIKGIITIAYNMGLRKNKERLIAQRSEANSRSVIIRYDDGRVFVARSRRAAAQLLGVHHSTVTKCLGRYLPIRRCRLIEDTAVGYGAYRKEYRAHPNTNTMPNPLAYLVNI